MEIKQESIAYNGYFKIKKFELYDPKSNKTLTKECFERGESVAALVYDSDKNTLLFVKQYRIGSQSEMLEIVAGSMDKEGESPLDTLKRELMEEMGVEIAPEENGIPNHHYLGGFYVSPGGTSEKVHVFIVDKIIKKENGGGVEDESIEIVELSPEELQEKIGNGEISDLKTSFAISTFLAAIN